MSQYRVGRPQQEVRLRNWPAGRLQGLRLMLSRLEEGLNDSLPAQVKQSNKRPVTDKIPFVLDSTVTINAGFRQFQVTFDAPPGLGGAGRGDTNSPDRQLLNYEIQHDSTNAFSDPTSILTPQTNILIGGVGLGEVRYFRIRVINTKFQASTWTKTFTSTAARGQFIITQLAPKSVRLSQEIGFWQTIFTESYPNPAGGKATIQAHLGVGAHHQDLNGGAKGWNGGPGHVQFRWLVDLATGDYIGNGDRCVISAIPPTNDNSAGSNPMGFGVFLSPFVQLPGSGTVNFRLQAALRQGSEWRGNAAGKALEKADPMIFVRNAKILEVLEDY